MGLTVEDPANPDSVLADLVAGLGYLGVCAVSILGPDTDSIFGRRPLISWPSSIAEAAKYLANSAAYGADWKLNRAPQVAWIDTDRQEDWLQPWQAQGCHALVRVAFDLPGEQTFEVYTGSNRKLAKIEVGEVVRDVISSWPVIKTSVLVPLAGLTYQQRRVLQFAFEGMTAKETALAMGVTERTVTHHLQAAQDKLLAKNKQDSIRKAIWLGVI